LFLFKLTSFLIGYVVIDVMGDAPEKFVNMAASRGRIPLGYKQGGERCDPLENAG